MSDAIEKHTVSAAFVQAAVRHLAPARRGEVLAQAGIAQGVLAAGHARVPATAYAALWMAVARELDDEFFGLDGRRMKVGSFALLAQAVLGCADLDRALRRMLRGFAVFLDDVQARLHIEAGAAVVRITNRLAQEEDRRFADETLLVMVHGLLCWLAGQRLPLRRVDFAQPRPPHAAEYALMFCDRVGFNAAHSALALDADLLALPVLQSPATLKQFLRTAPQSVFLRYRNEDSWSARVRRRLRDSAPPEWPVFEALASQVHSSPTTLRRRLVAEGTSYQALKDRLRNDLAIDALCDGGLSVDEIAARLGFQDASAFHRAFKRWNGLQPGEYRRRQQRARG